MNKRVYELLFFSLFPFAVFSAIFTATNIFGDDIRKGGGAKRKRNETFDVLYDCLATEFDQTVIIITRYLFLDRTVSGGDYRDIEKVFDWAFYGP